MTALTLGQRVRVYRKLRGFSARVLAERTGHGITRQVIANLESEKKGHVQSDQVEPLADALGVPLVALFGAEDEMLSRYPGLMARGLRTIARDVEVES